MEAAVDMGKTKVREGPAGPGPDGGGPGHRPVTCQRASEVGISEDAAAEIAQHTHPRVGRGPGPTAPPQGAARKVLVIGGAGRMGTWFARFLADARPSCPSLRHQAHQGFPHGEGPDRGHTQGRGGDHGGAHIRDGQGHCEQVIDPKPKGLVFDIMSVKEPVMPALREGGQEGVMVCCVHPMFGPDALSMYSRNIVVCDCGSPEAVDEVEEPGRRHGREDHGDAGRGARPADLVCAGPVPRGEHRLLRDPEGIGRRLQ